MKIIKLRIDTKSMKNHALDIGMEVGDKVIKAVEENGMVTIDLPESRAAELLGGETTSKMFSLLSPEKMTVACRSTWGVKNKIIQSVTAQKPVDGEGPEDKALELIDSLEKKYLSLDWEKEQFVNFCEENDIAVKGNWGINKMVKELIRFDSELKVTLEEYLK